MFEITNKLAINQIYKVTFCILQFFMRINLHRHLALMSSNKISNTKCISILRGETLIGERKKIFYKE